MKKVIGGLALLGIVAAFGYVAVTAFVTPSSPAPYTVRQAAQRLVAQFGPGLATQGTSIVRSKCIVIQDGKPVPTRSASATGTEFGCILSLSTKTSTACQGVDFMYPAGAADVTIKATTRLTARYCA